MDKSPRPSAQRVRILCETKPLRKTTTMFCAKWPQKTPLKKHKDHRWNAYEAALKPHLKADSGSQTAGGLRTTTGELGA
jgi:hypothetical protein